jgi:hypothetical protein
VYRIVQARLPDINTAFITYRRELLQGLQNKNYTNCIGSLNAMNSLLPKEYRVQISTIEFEDKIRQDVQATCTGCERQVDYHKIHVFDLALPFLESVLSRNKTTKSWICDTCKCINRLSMTRIAKTILQEPYHLTLVPSPPVRKTGIRDRNQYHHEFMKWVWRMDNEIEERLGQFRDDNWHKANEMYDYEDDIDTSQDEK